MKSSSPSAERPLWESAHDLYQNIREQEDRKSPPDPLEWEALAGELQRLTGLMMQELQQTTKGIITKEAKERFSLVVSRQAPGALEADDVLFPGDLRLLSPKFLPEVDRPFVVLLLDQDFETDLWTIVPLGPLDQAVRDGEWETGWDEPMLRVLCFWNAGIVPGCALEDSQQLDSLTPADLKHCAALHGAWSSGSQWDAADLEKSGPPDNDGDAFALYLEQENEIMRSLAEVKTFRPNTASRDPNMLASAGAPWRPHEEIYRMPGFGRSLSMQSLSPTHVGVALGQNQTPYMAKLVSPVLVTGADTEYPLHENEVIQVPVQELARGFWVKVADLGSATLVSVKN